METYQIVLIVVAVVAAIIVIGLITAYRAKKELYYKLLAKFGQPDNTEYEYDEFECISHYYKNTKGEEFSVDDITWNDLDMDNIYMLVNSTCSSVGRESLYKILRTPVSNQEVLAERERIIQYFDSHKEERTKVMMALKSIGYTKKISVSDYMDRLLNLKPGVVIGDILVNILLLASIAFMIFVDPVVGLFFLLISSGIAIITYYKAKARIENFFSCIRVIVAIVNAGKEISDLNLSELSEYNDYFKESAKRFSKATRNSFLLVSAKENNGSLIEILMEYIRMFTHVDIIKFTSILKHIKCNKEEIYTLYDKIGFIDSMISVASFRRFIPYYCQPDFTENNKLDLQDVYHLLIKEPVSNSIVESKPVLLTGSNASGKSTFLKSIAINAILAQSINTCPAKSYVAPFYRIYSSMALTDSIESGESYYIVEIKSLKRIMDAASVDNSKILCFVDEVLRGTNTVERIAASSQILKELALDGIMCFAATHDIELTYILEKYYSNYHFTEDVQGNEIVFSYALHEGRATSRNAIKLLEIIGYDKAIVDKAQERAEDFVNTGAWRQI